MNRTTALLLAALALVGCEDAASSIVVDVRTDFVPGAEFFAVEVRAEPAEGSALMPRRAPALRTDDFLGGVRVAEWGAVARGRYDVTAILLDAAGQVLLQ